MNTPPPFPSDQPAPTLKLPRRDSAPAGPAPELTVEQRWQLEVDLAGLREREANLRQYEARLRAWQDQLDAGRVQAPQRSATPFGGSISPLSLPDEYELRDNWDKLHRARALLEAEQKQLRDDRMALRDGQAMLEKREQDLATREQAVAQREQQIASAAATVAALDEHERSSAVRRLTQAPLQVARSVFKTGK